MKSKKLKQESQKESLNQKKIQDKRLNNDYYNFKDKDSVSQLYNYLNSYFSRLNKELREDAIQETLCRLLELGKDEINFFDDIKGIQNKVKAKIERESKKFLLDENIDKMANDAKLSEIKPSGSIWIDCPVCGKSSKKFISKIKRSNLLFCSNKCRGVYYYSDEFAENR